MILHIYNNETFNWATQNLQLGRMRPANAGWEQMKKTLSFQLTSLLKIVTRLNSWICVRAEPYP